MTEQQQNDKRKNHKLHQEMHFWGIMFIIVSLPFILMFLISIITAFFQAKAFNSATGANITTGQALMLDLRIVGTNSHN